MNQTQVDAVNFHRTTTSPFSQKFSCFENTTIMVASLAISLIAAGAIGFNAYPQGCGVVIGVGGALLMLSVGMIVHLFRNNQRRAQETAPTLTLKPIPEVVENPTEILRRIMPDGYQGFLMGESNERTEFKGKRINRESLTDLGDLSQALNAIATMKCMRGKIIEFTAPMPLKWHIVRLPDGSFNSQMTGTSALISLLTDPNAWASVENH